MWAREPKVKTEFLETHSLQKAVPIKAWGQLRANNRLLSSSGVREACKGIFTC